MLNILKRIGYSGSLDVTPEVLKALQKAFLYSVPFENLDIHARIPITLDPQRFYQKIVQNGRGGFCYECNSVFYQLLLELGFDAHFVAARMTETDINNQRYSHMALLVNLDRPYLVDVGNGQSVHVPMAIGDNTVSEAEGIQYKVAPFDSVEYALYFRKQDPDWHPRFVFSINPRRLEEFGQMCLFHQTSPDSLFMKQRLCTLPTTGGRMTLLDNQFNIMENGNETTVTLESDQEIDAILQQYFKLRLPATIGD